MDHKYICYQTAGIMLSGTLEFSWKWGISYSNAVSPGGRLNKTVSPGMAIPMLKIRRPNGRLIFNMEIAIRR